MVHSGLDGLVRGGFSQLKGSTIGIVCNQASIDSKLDHVLDLLSPLHGSGFLKIQAVFGPQHGLFGHTQDNMIEWEGGKGANWPVHSLYGEHRQPTAEMLKDIEVLVVDLPDVGARYYTFLWTLSLCMQSCARAGIRVMVLDRPNPIGGEQVEGTVLQPEFSSFVGLEPLPTRHGMTLGEVAHYFAGLYGCELTVQPVEGWDRQMYFDATRLPWAMPSPNMPTLDTAVVYPGGCLIEGTNLSEGRGTTRPFETIGAPFLHAAEFCLALNDLGLAGVKYRPVQFEPTFNKHSRQVCEGCCIHVLDRAEFEPVLSFVALLQVAAQQGGSEFSWKLPPYEYEYEKLPIDILAGNSWLRSAIEGQTSLAEVRERFQSECAQFEPTRRAALLY